MQRRLELACALVHEPVLLFVDEPTAGLDPMLRSRLWTEFRRLRDLGRTLVVTTQYVDESEYCDEVAVLVRGRLIALAAPDELRRTAIGGDIVEIRTQGSFEGSTLEGVSGVRAVRQLTPRTLMITVDDAGSAIPRLLQEIQAAGMEVASSSEYRPTYDEVFSALVTGADGSASAVAGAA
jgi:ABC-2 type transport system ATP-binding protein